MRWQNSENRDMGITTSTYWADVRQQICPTGASTLPMMGKHVAHFNPNRLLGLAWISFFGRVDFAF